MQNDLEDFRAYWIPVITYEAVGPVVGKIEKLSKIYGTNSSEIAALVAKDCNKEISSKTIRRVLKDAGYFAGVARRKLHKRN